MPAKSDTVTSFSFSLLLLALGFYLGSERSYTLNLVSHKFHLNERPTYCMWNKSSFYMERVIFIDFMWNEGSLSFIFTLLMRNTQILSGTSPSFHLSCSSY